MSCIVCIKVNFACSLNSLPVFEMRWRAEIGVLPSTYNL